MYKFVLLIVVLSVEHKTLFGAELPEDIEKCHFGDSQCLVKSMNDLIRRYPMGISVIGLAPLDATRLENIWIFRKPATENLPFWLSFQIRDLLNKGFNNATITHIEGFDRDPSKRTMIIETRIPNLVHEGIYDMQARILLFRANTTGNFRSDFQNVRMNLTIKSIQEYRHNKRYLRVIYELKPTIDLDRWKTWIHSLYKENTDLTIALNQLMNENWLEFWNDIEPGVLNALALCLMETLNKIFDKVAYDDMFLPDG